MKVICKHPAGVVLPGAGEALAEGLTADLSKEQAVNPAVQGWLKAGLLAPVTTK